MRKLTPDETTLVRLIAEAGGGYAPETHTISGASRQLLHALYRKGSLRAEETNGVTVYELTPKGWADAA
jgi:DNA-binding PadR family transcriptional regulator